MSENNIDSRIEIELLKKDVNVVTSLLSKFDTTLDKLQEIASNLSRMVSLQEQRLEVQEETTKEVQSILEMRRQEHNQNIKDIYNRINSINKDLTDRIEDTERRILDELRGLKEELKKDKSTFTDRVSKIEAWKWMVMGAIAVCGWLVGQAINLAKLIN